tara:strand:+ start:517 stop:789 length:273 start_codon:yes stop_codon:yes gene_type:complete
MSYKQENRDGKIVVIHPHTGKVMGRFVAKHFADDFASRLPEPESSTPKRARTPKGKLKSDDPSTPEVNEAWEGGKAPKKKAPAKKKAKKK